MYTGRIREWHVCFQAFDRTMDQKIALHGKILGDRCHDSDYIFLKVSMIISGDKLIVSNLGRVEFQDLFRGFDSIQRAEVISVPSVLTNQTDAFRYSCMACS